LAASLLVAAAARARAAIAEFAAAPHCDPGIFYVRAFCIVLYWSAARVRMQ